MNKMFNKFYCCWCVVIPTLVTACGADYPEEFENEPAHGAVVEQPDVVDTIRSPNLVFNESQMASGAIIRMGEEFPNRIQLDMSAGWDKPDAEDSGSYSFNGVVIDAIDLRTVSDGNGRCALDENETCQIGDSSDCLTSGRICRTWGTRSLYYDHMEFGVVQDNNGLGYASNSPRWHAWAGRGSRHFTGYLDGDEATSWPPTGDDLEPVGGYSTISFNQSNESIKEPGDIVNSWNRSTPGNPVYLGFDLYQNPTSGKWFMKIDRGDGWEEIGWWETAPFHLLDHKSRTGSYQSHRYISSIFVGGFTNDEDNDIGSGEYGHLGNEDFVAHAKNVRYTTRDSGSSSSWKDMGFVSGFEGTVECCGGDSDGWTEDGPYSTELLFGGRGDN